MTERSIAPFSYIGSAPSARIPPPHPLMLYVSLLSISSRDELPDILFSQNPDDPSTYPTTLNSDYQTNEVEYAESEAVNSTRTLKHGSMQYTAAEV